MKKIKMNLQNLDNAEVLTREQLKKVLGGTAGSTTQTPTVTTTVNCTGECGGGDHSEWTANCTGFACSCESTMASWSTCDFAS